MRPGREDIVIKLLSVDPTNYDDAPAEGIRRILEIATGETIPRGAKLDPSKIGMLYILHQLGRYLHLT
jgi:5-oxoprolinase (ATP-hydrolysing)